MQQEKYTWYEVKCPRHTDGLGASYRLGAQVSRCHGSGADQVRHAVETMLRSEKDHIHIYGTIAASGTLRTLDVEYLHLSSV